MTRALWTVLIAVGLAWSGLCWFLALVAGSGGRAVTTITRWLGADVSTTQWLADTLATIGGTVQIVIWIIWAIGAGTLVVVGWFGSRLSRDAANAAERMAKAQRGYLDPDQMSDGQVFEGEIRSRDISEPPPDR